MNKLDLFAPAKGAIFGVAPTEPKALIGYNMAKSYFEPYIEDAESVLQNLCPPRADLDVILFHAFQYDAYKSFSLMPKETQSTIKSCTNRFYARYHTLIKSKKLKVA